MSVDATQHSIASAEQITWEKKSNNVQMALYILVGVMAIVASLLIHQIVENVLPKIELFGILGTAVNFSIAFLLVALSLYPALRLVSVYMSRKLGERPVRVTQ